MDDKRERGLVPWLKGVVAPRSNKNNGEPYDIFCVVADDERHFREQILRELDCLVKQRPDVRVGIAAADSLEELFSLAFAGNAGIPATILLLDLALEHQQYLWKIYANSIVSWMRRLNMLFPVTTSGRRIDQDILEKCFDRNHPDGKEVALVLRAAGFLGNIDVLSNTGGGNEDWFFNSRLKDIQELIPDLHIQTPIVDRVIHKQGFSGHHVIPHPTRPLLSADTSSAREKNDKKR